MSACVNNKVYTWYCNFIQSVTLIGCMFFWVSGVSMTTDIRDISSGKWYSRASCRNHVTAVVSRQCSWRRICKMKYEPAHDITNRVFAVRMLKPCILGYPISAHGRPWSDWAGAQADPSPRWAHTSFCWFCHALALISTYLNRKTFKNN